MPELTPEEMRNLSEAQWVDYLRRQAEAPALAPEAPALAPPTIATGQAPPDPMIPPESPRAIVGRKGGLKGGKARAKRLSAKLP